MHCGFYHLLLHTLYWSFRFVLAFFTCPWYTVISITCALYILLSFGFVSYSHPSFVILVLVFLVPHIKLVHLAFFILFSIFKVWYVLCPCPLDLPLTTIQRLNLFVFYFASLFYQLRMMNKVRSTESWSPMFSFTIPFQKRQEKKTCPFSRTYSWNKGGLRLFLFQEYGPMGSQWPVTLCSENSMVIV